MVRRGKGSAAGAGPRRGGNSARSRLAAAGLLAAMLSAPALAGDGAPDAAAAARRDPALLAIAGDICRELMTAEQVHRRLNAYQLVALAGIVADAGDDGTAMSFFDTGTAYCRSAGMAVWATFSVDERRPPRAIEALAGPPARVLDLRFRRVAPPSPAQQPDRLAAAARAAEDALQNMPSGDGASQSPPGATRLPDAARRGPQPIVPTAIGGPAPGGGTDRGTGADTAGGPHRARQ